MPDSNKTSNRALGEPSRGALDDIQAYLVSEAV